MSVSISIGILKGIFSTAYAEGAIPRDVIYALIRPKTSPANEKCSLTPEETQRILVTIQEHPEGLVLGVLYYLGLRRGEALGLKWGDFDFESDMVHIQRDIDFTDSVAREDTLKTTAADRFVPVPKELKELLLPHKGKEDGFVFHTDDGGPIPQGAFKRMWLRLMLASDCVEWREVGENASRPGDIVKNVKAMITPHWLRHNYVTMLYESGVDPLVAMKIVGHRDYQTTANIYTHLKEETLRKASVNLNEVFRKRKV